MILNQNKFFYKEYIYKNVTIFVNKRSNINWDFVLKSLPRIDTLLGNIESIYYGQHEELKQKQNLSVYNQNSILISDEVGDEELVLKCIAHECIHSHVDDFEKNIFFKKASKEYLEKKKYVLNMTGETDEFINLLYYNSNFDKYLLNIGYDKLNKIIKGKFPSSYSVTSFIEYVAICTEELYFGDSLIIKKMCPNVIKFIKNIGGTLEEN